MLTATITLNLSKNQSVVKTNVTPAEAAYYIAEHNSSFGDNPVSDIRDESEVKRSPGEEIRRLYARFPTKKIKVLYPAMMSNVPETFEEASVIGMGTNIPAGNLIDVDVSNA